MIGQKNINIIIYFSFSQHRTSNSIMKSFRMLKKTTSSMGLCSVLSSFLIIFSACIVSHHLFYECSIFFILSFFTIHSHSLIFYYEDRLNNLDIFKNLMLAKPQFLYFLKMILFKQKSNFFFFSFWLFINIIFLFHVLIDESAFRVLQFIFQEQICFSNQIQV